MGFLGEHLIASFIASYDGNRGCINYLAVHPNFRKQGYGKQLLRIVEVRLRALDYPKINLQIREENCYVSTFYQKLGFVKENVIRMGKRLEDDK